jgi:hypothetical protein
VGIGDNWSRAFFWDPQQSLFMFLSDEASEANDINDRGDVVGWTGQSVREAVIWRVRGKR